MNREEFLYLMEGFEGEPFWIRMTGRDWSEKLTFDTATSSCARALSDGVPHIFRLSEISEITFREPGARQVPQARLTEKAPKQEIAARERLLLEEEPEEPNEPDAAEGVQETAGREIPPRVERAEREITLYEFSPVDRTEEIRAQIKDTPLEKEWIRCQNMLSDARKNGELQTKGETVVQLLEQLYQQYPCVELMQMIGSTFVEMGDCANGSLQYEIAGDYPNAAAYASMCGDESEEYLFSIFRKWLLDGETDTAVVSSFFAVCADLRRGRDCAETVLRIMREPRGREETVFYGLLRVLSEYVPAASLSEFESPRRIPEMVSMLLAKTADEPREESESAPPSVARHASEIWPKAQSDEVYTGYILKVLSTYGFIGQNMSEKKGTYYAVTELSPELLFHHSSLYGLKVSYRLATRYHDGRQVLQAVSITADEDLDEFLERKGAEEERYFENARAMLDENPDGTFSGFIINIRSTGYGFLNKDETEVHGVFFQISELRGALETVDPGCLKGMKVTCKLEIAQRYEGKRPCAREILPAEDLETFLESKGLTLESAKPKNYRYRHAEADPEPAVTEPTVTEPTVTASEQTATEPEQTVTESAQTATESEPAAPGQAVTEPESVAQEPEQTLTEPEQPAQEDINIDVEIADAAEEPAEKPGEENE